MTRVRVGPGLVSAFRLAGLFCLLAWLAAAQGEDAPVLSTTVRRVGAPVAAPDAAMSPRPARDDDARPTTPGGKLPQYQLDHWHRILPTEEEISDPRLRFILALPTKPILIEGSFIIDGVPFRQARENRIRKLLEELANPRPVEPSPQLLELEAEPVSGVDSGAEATETQKAPEEKAVETKPVEVKLPDAKTSEESSPEETRLENTSGDAGDEKSVEDKPAEDVVPEKPAVNPPTVDRYQLPASVVERLRRQMEATGRPASVEEIRWLLTNWIDGPSLLMLHDSFQRFRANERPAFFVLDRDRDGGISPAEISSCAKSFQECDFDRNDIVEYTELERAADDPRRHKANHGGPGQLIFLLPTNANAVVIWQRLVARYAPETLSRFDADASGVFDHSELLALKTVEPDLRLTIEFDTTNPDQSRVSVSGSGEFGQVAVEHGSATEAGISLELGGNPVVFSALQGNSADQISIGAVMDGYPILPIADPRADGRFTIRELRELGKRLTTLDRNQDGSISADEASSTIRVCFGLGPLVHRELAGLREVGLASSETETAGPDWFIRMDRNRDNDLTRSEFPGTDEQFTLLDNDHDALVSADEALEFDRKSNQSEQDPVPSGDSSPKPNATEDGVATPNPDPSEQPVTSPEPESSGL